MRVGVTTASKHLATEIQKIICSEANDVRFFKDLLQAVSGGESLIFAEWREGEELYGFLAGLREARKLQRSVVVLVPLGCVTAMRRALEVGATDVLFCPPDREELLAEIAVIDQGKNVANFKPKLYQKLRETNLVGESTPFQKCLRDLRLAAQSDANVLLIGETGTGKEMFARAIHDLSKKAKLPFSAISCADYTESLIASELFGHIKGAYTGADKARLGRFRKAGEGTLFIDEVGRINLSTQVKLLRVLDQRVFSAVGSDMEIPFQARLICAISSDMEQLVRHGKFHQDLRGRIDQFRIVLPPLRDRKSDIPILIDHFLRKHVRNLSVRISKSAQASLENHDFPENVRELENILLGALARCGSGNLILPQHLPDKIITSKNFTEDHNLVIKIPQSLNYKEARELALKYVDKFFLEMLLEKAKGNKKRRQLPHKSTARHSVLGSRR